jgi:hypothetical protein
VPPGVPRAPWVSGPPGVPRPLDLEVPWLPWVPEPKGFRGPQRFPGYYAKGSGPPRVFKTHRGPGPYWSLWVSKPLG